MLRTFRAGSTLAGVRCERKGPGVSIALEIPDRAPRDIGVGWTEGTRIAEVGVAVVDRYNALLSVAGRDDSQKGTSSAITGRRAICGDRVEAKFITIRTLSYPYSRPSFNILGKAFSHNCRAHSA